MTLVAAEPAASWACPLHGNNNNRVSAVTLGSADVTGAVLVFAPALCRLQQAAGTNRVTVRFSSFGVQVSHPGVEQREEKRAGRTKTRCSGSGALRGDLCQPSSRQTADERPRWDTRTSFRTFNRLQPQPPNS